MAQLKRLDSHPLNTTPAFSALLRSISVSILAALCVLGAMQISPAQANSRYAALVIDGHTGRTVYSRNADRPRYPASLTKVMTLYLLFEELDAGRISLNTRMRVSARAASQPPSKLGLERGTSLTVDQALRALVTKSANDAAVVIAEHISGSEYRFAQRMTTRARSLGMRRTRFMNASGLPNSRQLTTARDMATLARRVQEDFPNYYGYFAITEFRFNGRRYTNHNNLVGRYAGTTGLKTGYTRASGFNLTTTVERDGKYLIGVVLGGRSARSRDDHMVSILDRAWNSAVARLDLGTRFASMPLPRSRPGTQTAPRLSLASNTRLPAPPPQGDRSATLDLPAEVRVAAIEGLRSTTYPSEADAFDRNSWVVQVGAYAEPSLAVERIREAINAAPMQLANAVPITMPVSSNSQTLYRSRIGNLTKTAARSACVELTRVNISCIAIPPRGWGRTALYGG
ncbi:MAG: D-alanyl-D-alanine carboxypeptidase [Rhodobiaceae bacterium]|nr:MAG: D-alanyl-D-alanine carboxypeptidase [Rhodobiaceae bacterium]